MVENDLGRGGVCFREVQYCYEAFQSLLTRIMNRAAPQASET
jgi:hypothetical protein